MRALLALAALGSLSPCIGSEAPEPAPPAAAPKAGQADQTIDMARQDFQTLRAPGAALEPKSDLPKFEMPSISFVPFQRAPSASAKAAAESGKQGLTGDGKEGAKSGDWLVRAMEEGAPSGSASDPRGAGARTQTDPVRRPALDEDPGKAAADRGAAAEPAKLESRHADNPLDAYMTQWISPREQGVLLPAAAGSAPAENTEPNTGGSSFASNLGESMAGSNAQPLPEIEGLSTMRESMAPAASIAPSQNPYLAAVEAPLGVASLQTALLPAAASGFLQGSDLHLGQEAPPLSISSPGTDSRSGIPDFAQPSDDDKYFKQLKKF